MGKQNREDEEGWKSYFCDFDGNPDYLEYTDTENFNTHSLMSVFGYPPTPISAPRTSTPPAQSQFPLTPPLPSLIQYQDGTFCYSTQRSGLEQNSIVAEESGAKKKLEAKPKLKRPSKKPRSSISKHDLELQFGKTRIVAAADLDISLSTLKRLARDHGITRWPCNKRSRGNSDQIAPTVKKEKNERVMIVKAQYNNDIIKFEFSSLSKMADLREEVSKRLDLNVESFEIKYIDDEGDWVLLPFDNDLECCMRSAKETTIKMSVII